MDINRKDFQLAMHANPGLVFFDILKKLTTQKSQNSRRKLNNSTKKLISVKIVKLYPKNLCLSVKSHL